MCALRWIGSFAVALLLGGCADINGTSKSGRGTGFYVVEDGQCDDSEDNIETQEECKEAVDAVGPDPEPQLLDNQTWQARRWQANRSSRPFGCWAERCRSPEGYDCGFGIGDEEFPEVPPGEFTTLCKRKCNRGTDTPICSGHGDPILTNTFFKTNAEIRHHGMGLVKLAQSEDDTFEVQAFQCPYGTKGAANFGAFAVRKSDKKFTVTDQGVKVWTLDDKDGGVMAGLDASFPKTPKWESQDKCFAFEADMKTHKLGANGIIASMSIEGPKFKEVGACGDSKYVKEEFDFMADKGGKRKHLGKDESLFPSSVLDHLCTKCAGYAFTNGMTDKNIAMFCDVCEKYEDNQFCTNIRSRRLSDTDNATVAPVDPLEACDGDIGKLEEAKQGCQNLANSTHHFDQCCYDMCVTMTETTVGEQEKQASSQAVVDGAAESKRKLDEIAAKRAAAVKSGSTSKYSSFEWILYLVVFCVLAR